MRRKWHLSKQGTSVDKREGDVMGASLLLFALVVTGSLAIQLLAVAIYYWRNSWRYGRQVVATVKQIQVWLDGWYVTAVWTDMLTGQNYTFQSPRIEFSLKQRVGDNVIVDIDPNHPERYWMRL